MADPRSPFAPPASPPADAATGPAALLEIKNLYAGYGESQVLHGISLTVHPGEVVTLLGRNGAGKTTTLRAIMGIVDRRRGAIRFEGRDLIGRARHQVARLGIGYVPEERGIFASLTVDENLMLPPVVRPGGMSIAQIHALFPQLQGRGDTQGTRLSGGEQQMLAIARILRTGAPLILLDEPTEGLAPTIVAEIARALQSLKQRGFTILLVEQNFRFAATLADRHYLMEEGRMVDMILNSEIEAAMPRLHDVLGV